MQVQFLIKLFSNSEVFMSLGYMIINAAKLWLNINLIPSHDTNMYHAVAAYILTFYMILT